MTMTISPDPSSHPSIKSLVRSMIQSPIKSPQPAISQPSASPGQNTILRAILLSCTAIIEKSHNPPATPKRIVENEQKPISQRTQGKGKPTAAPPQRAAALRRRPHLHKTKMVKHARLQEIVWLSFIRLACPGVKAERKDLNPGLLAATPLQLSWLFSRLSVVHDGMAKD